MVAPSSDPIRVSVVAPCFDEVEGIEAVVRRWDEVLDVRRTLAVTAALKSSQLTHSAFVAQRTKVGAKAPQAERGVRVARVERGKDDRGHGLHYRCLLQHDGAGPAGRSACPHAAGGR